MILGIGADGAALVFIIARIHRNGVQHALDVIGFDNRPTALVVIGPMGVPAEKIVRVGHRIGVMNIGPLFHQLRHVLIIDRGVHAAVKHTQNWIPSSTISRCAMVSPA